MRITSFRIENYKCFFDSGSISLACRMNVFVGRNDVGKTALLEALSLRSGAAPHRSLRTAPKASSQINTPSKVTITYGLEPGELNDYFLKLGSFFTQVHDPEFAVALTNLSVSNSEFVLETTNGGSQIAFFKGLSTRPSPNGMFQLIQTRKTGNNIIFESVGMSHGQQSFEIPLSSFVRSKVYAFHPERLNVASHPINADGILAPNAANLADVLNQLSSRNRPRFDRLMKHLRTIFPHITTITAPATGGAVAQINVWTVPVESERADLAIPLSASGTGIGQVLAMLYVVVTADMPKVIIIDEPQSFLHPGALRALLEILREYPIHQYILTTHSPAGLGLIESKQDDAMFLIRRDSEAQESRIDKSKPTMLSTCKVS